MLNSIKNILKILVLGLLLCNIVFAGTLTEELKELNRMYQAGFLTKDEFIKAKSILLDEESLSESKKIPVEKVEDLPNIKKLEKLYKSGLLTKEQYTKAKSILQKKIELQKSKSQNIQIRKFKPNFNKKEFEKMEMIVGDYRFYTHRPGGIKVRRISDGKQLLVLGDNSEQRFKI